MRKKREGQQTKRFLKQHKTWPGVHFIFLTNIELNLT